MFMASNYTDTTDTDFKGVTYNISEGKPLSAEGVRNALHTKENVANKTDAIDNSNSSSSAQYPSVKAVYAAFTSLSSTLNTLSFFPKGAVLMYSSTAWNSASADFKKTWHICDGSTVNGYTTLNLVNKFIRGAAASGQTGGTDSAQLPSHSHTFSGNNTGGSFGNLRSDENNTRSIMFGRADGVFYSIDTNAEQHRIVDEDCGLNKRPSGSYIIGFSLTPSGSISTEGSASPDNRPAFCTVIFIEKIV
jgi:hypothetical protein